MMIELSVNYRFKTELMDTAMNRQLISVLQCSKFDIHADSPEATSLSGKTCPFLQEHRVTSCWPVKLDSRNKRNKETRENECWHLPPTSCFLTLVWSQSKTKVLFGFSIFLSFFLHQLCAFQWQMADWLFQGSQVAFRLQTNMFLLKFH